MELLDKTGQLEAENILIKQKHLSHIIKFYKLSENEVLKRIHKYQKLTGYALTIFQFDMYDFGSKSEKEALEFCKCLREQKYYLKLIKNKIALIENEDYSSLNSYFDILKDLIGKTFRKDKKTRIYEMMCLTEFDIKGLSEIDLDKLVIDMEFMKIVFDYSFTEYIMFDFLHKSLKERLEFLTIAEKRIYAEKLCKLSDSDIFNSKWLTYKNFKEYYKRDVLLIENKTSYDCFVNFCEKHKKVIVKPLTELKGKGIKILDFLDKKNFREEFNLLMQEEASYLIEELIRQDKFFNDYNPDSVNTVRIISYYDGKVYLKWPLLRVGRKGSIVDNAGAGGIFAAIDIESGKIISNGCDENGIKYERHPDSNIIFKGASIPDWENLLDICTSLVMKIPTIRYIGWDFTYTKNHEWILVEGNIQPGCRAYQASTGKGIKREFLKLVQANNVDNKNSHVISVAKKANITYDEALKLMEQVKVKYGISYAYYDKKNLYLTNDIRMVKYAELYKKTEADKQRHYQNVCNNYKISKEDVDIFIERIRIICNYALPVYMVDVYDLYGLEEEKLFSLIYELKRRDVLISSIKLKLEKIDLEQLDYKDILDMVEELRGIIKATIPNIQIEDIRKKILNAMNDRKFDEEELFDLIVDIRLTNQILEFYTSEYLSYHFEGKSIEYKHQFICNSERLYFLRTVNNIKTSETLDDKYLSYLRFKKYYNREVLLIDDGKCYNTFVDFCKKNKVFVKKPLAESQGKGVNLVKIDENTNFKELFHKLREEDNRLIVEQVIEQNDVLKAFNADSVNTVRIITYNNGNNVRLMFSFFRTGRKGSFVDNGGRGGVFAKVDVNTGIITSNGGDELGRRYECHPDTGLKYKGFQLPDWDKLVDFSKTLANTIPDMCYIGWDFAYDRNKQWIIVEYNSYPEFLHQGPSDEGCRKEFLDTINEFIKNKK